MIRGDTMAINTEINTRVNVTIPKKMYNKIQLLAKEDMRSANSLMVFLMSQALQNEEWENKIKALIQDGKLEE